MKKFLSIVLVAVMLLSTLTLTSCDRVVRTISDMLSSLKASMGNDGDEYVTSGTIPPWDRLDQIPPEEKDVITEEQYKTALSKTYFYLVSQRYYSDNGYSSSWTYVTPTAKGSRPGDDFYGFAIDYAKVDGVWYYLSKTENGYQGTPLLHEMDMTLGSVISLNDVAFSDLTYDATKGCYTFFKAQQIDEKMVEIPYSLHFKGGELEFVEVFWNLSGDLYKEVIYISTYYDELTIPEFKIVE